MVQEPTQEPTRKEVEATLKRVREEVYRVISLNGVIYQTPLYDFLNHATICLDIALRHVSDYETR